MFFALNSTVTEGGGCNPPKKKESIAFLFFIKKMSGGELMDRLSSHFEIESLRGVNPFIGEIFKRLQHWRKKSRTLIGRLLRSVCHG